MTARSALEQTLPQRPCVHEAGASSGEHRPHAIRDERIARVDHSSAVDELRRRAFMHSQALGFGGIGREKHIAPAIELEGVRGIGIEGVE